MNTMTHKCKGIEKLSESDIGRWVTYVDPFNGNERGKIKSFNNETKVAFVVFKCNGNWLSNWKDFTAPSCNYMDLEFSPAKKSLIMYIKTIWQYLINTLKK